MSAAARRLPPSFPFSIAAFLTLTLWTQRTGGFTRATGTWQDLLSSLAAAVGVALFGWFAARLFTRDADRRALCALLAVLWALLYGSYSVFARSAFGGGLTLILAWTAGTLLLAALVLASRQPLERVSRMLGIAGALLLAMQLPGLLRRPEAAAAEATWTDTRRPDRPDIYILVLDKYARGDWLQAAFGVDHRPFEDSLRALGFVVPTQARANYAHTKLAITTFLEGDYAALPGLRPSRSAYDELGSRIRGARLWSELQALGYRVVFFPTPFNASQWGEGVDLVLPVPKDPPRLDAETFWVNAPLAPLAAMRCRVLRCPPPPPRMPYPAESHAEMAWKFRTVATLPDSAGPVAAFVHLLVPHEPYLFAEDCSPRTSWWPLTDQDATLEREIRTAYAVQVRCTTRWILEAVTELMRRSRTPPVILLQSDHGHGLIFTDPLRGITLDRDQLSADQVNERMSVFAAYHFPRARELVWNDITPVNVIPLMKHAVFGDSLRRRPDRTLWSTYQGAMSVTDITVHPPAR